MAETSRSVRAAAPAAALALLLLAAPPATADVYVYTDAQGVVYFTDNPSHEGFVQYGKRRRVRPAARSGRSAWDGVIRRVAQQHGVDPALVKAVIHAESAFDTAAVSKKGAQGLMQLMPRTARSLGVEDPFDAWQNIEGGTRHLGYLMERYAGNATLALAAYNAGGRAVRRYGGVPPYAETRSYVRKVLALRKHYDADFR